MKTSVVAPCAAVIFASIIAGCGSGGNVATTAVTAAPAPNATCTPPAGYTIQEVFPQNNGTAVANLQGVVFAVGPSPQPGVGSPSPLPTNWFVYAVSPTYGSTYGTSSVAALAPVPGATASSTPTPLPTPSDAPSFSNFIYETASIGTFATGTKFTIYLANTNCNTGIQESTFTTSTTDLPSPSPSPTST